MHKGIAFGDYIIAHSATVAVLPAGTALVTEFGAAAASSPVSTRSQAF